MTSSTAQQNNAESLSAYDFKNPRRIEPEQRETLKVIHESYAHALSVVLSSFLKSDVKVALEYTEQQTFAEYIKLLNPITCIAIFDMKMLNGYGLLEIESPLVYSAINRMMGGGGKVGRIEKPFTELEVSIARKLVHLLLKQLGHSWSSLLAIDFEVKDLQFNPAFARITPEREICIVMSLKITMSDVSGLITLCIPYSNLEPIAGKLGKKESSYVIPQSQDTKEVLAAVLGDVEMDVTAILGSIRFSMEDILSLEPGDILNLGQKARHPIDLRVAGKSKFKVIPGLMGKFRAVSIEQEMTEENT